MLDHFTQNEEIHKSDIRVAPQKNARYFMDVTYDQRLSIGVSQNDKRTVW